MAESDENMTNDIEHTAASTDAPAFASNWNEEDTTLLQPTRLDRAKPLRAWERKPASPFTRQRLRVGKVWKRNASRSNSTGRNATGGDAREQAEERTVRRLRAGEGTQSPVKIVKRLCLGANEGVGLSWDRAGSPRKKEKGRIVTRSSQAREEELLELEDEEEETGWGGVGDDVDEEDEEVEGTVIEFLDEDGKTLAEPGTGDEDGWADIDNPGINAGQHDSSNPLDNDLETSADTLTTLQPTESAHQPLPEGFISPVKPPSRRTRIQRAEAKRRQTLPHEFAPAEALRSHPDEANTPHMLAEQGDVVGTLHQPLSGGGAPDEEEKEPDEMAAEREGEEQLLRHSPATDNVVPRDETSEARFESAPDEDAALEDALLDSRLRIALGNLEDLVASEGRDTAEGQERLERAQQLLLVAADGKTADERQRGQDMLRVMIEQISAEREEEDVEMEMDEEQESAETRQGGEEEWQDVSEGEDDEMTEGEEDIQTVPGEVLPTAPQETAGEDVHEAEMEDTHPCIQATATRSPRRSSRRHSSTPHKQSSIRSITDAPHILAFSPVKRPSRYPSPPPSSNETQAMLPDEHPETTGDASPDSPHPLERSTSAPPEEPRISSRLKTPKPRISDDTAFIQAFLSRAGESKAERLAAENRNARPRRTSLTHEKESLSNRRDSDTVRQALSEGGSGGKGEALVLGDLDTNSPAPKRFAVSTSDAPDDALVLDDGTSLPTYKPAPAAAADDPMGAEEDQSTAATGTGRRRSIRDRRRPPGRAATTANTFALRGDHEPIVLKRSEAQELANVTRANTRKNKGTSMMPTLRLTKIAAEKRGALETDVEGGAERDGQGEQAMDSVKARKGIRWDETLAYYQEAPVELEPQLLELGDSGKAAKLQGQGMEEDEQAAEDMMKPIPAAETPSKPKIRKLSARRTASTPGKAPVMPLPPDNAAEMEGNSKPKEKKSSKRARIATPGKAVSALTSTPAEEPAAVTAPLPPPSTNDTNQQQQPKALGRKKIASRLPAPAATKPAPDSHSLTSSAAHTSSLFPGPDQSTESHTLTSSPAKRKTAPATSTSTFTPSTKGGVPRLTFGRGKLGLPTPASGPATGSFGAALMSPAKKASRAVNFGGTESGSGQEEKARGLGLKSSPAKKRARR